MMKHIAILVLSLFLLNSMTAQKINKRYKDKKDKTHLVGICTKSALQEAPFKEWYDKVYSKYEVNTSILDKIKGQTSGLSFEIFMGTWCGDSKRQVPRFYKVLEYLNVSEDKIKLVNLSNWKFLYKESPTNEHVGKDVFRVPTIIISKNGKEIGRIVERPVSSLELDLVQIAKGFAPNNYYQIVTEIQKEFKSKVPETKEEIKALAVRVAGMKKKSGDLNSYAYLLLGKEQLKEALVVFKINTMLYSRDGNTFDSLGEALMKNGENFEALKAYSKSLELDKNNENAIKKIAELVKKMDEEKNGKKDKDPKDKKA